MGKETKDVNVERLGKIVQLARRGVGGERANAMSLLKAMCKKHGLDVDEVLHRNNEVVEEYELCYKHAYMEDVAAQVLFRYAVMSNDEPLRISRRHKILWFKTTKEKYIETIERWRGGAKAYW